MTTQKRLIFSFITLLLIGSGCAAFSFYTLFRKPFLAGNSVSLYVTPSTSFNQLCDTLAKQASPLQIKIFTWICTHKGYNQKLHSGHYALPGQASLYKIFLILTRGEQTPVKLTFNNIRTPEQLAGQLANQLMADSLSFLTPMSDSAVYASFGFTPQTIASLFLPNTYELYWTVTPLRFMERMHTEHKHFWNHTRMAKAQKLNITPLQASIIASIAEEETNNLDEIGIVCGVYYNRLKQNMPLQADPTIKFALRQFDLNRILLTHLETDSPYNTYKNAGLPPGPIRIPDARTIDALLNHEPHRYLFMCANEDLSGTHRFTASLAEHNRNAKRYQAELNRRKIYR